MPPGDWSYLRGGGALRDLAAILLQPTLTRLPLLLHRYSARDDDIDAQLAEAERIARLAEKGLPIEGNARLYSERYAEAGGENLDSFSARGGSFASASGRAAEESNRGQLAADFAPASTGSFSVLRERSSAPHSALVDPLGNRSEQEAAARSAPHDHSFSNTTPPRDQVTGVIPRALASSRQDAIAFDNGFSSTHNALRGVSNSHSTPSAASIRDGRTPAQSSEQAYLDAEIQELKRVLAAAKASGQHPEGENSTTSTPMKALWNQGTPSRYLQDPVGDSYAPTDYISPYKHRSHNPADPSASSSDIIAHNGDVFSANYSARFVAHNRDGTRAQGYSGGALQTLHQNQPSYLGTSPTIHDNDRRASPNHPSSFAGLRDARMYSTDRSNHLAASFEEHKQQLPRTSEVHYHHHAEGGSRNEQAITPAEFFQQGLAALQPNGKPTSPLRVSVGVSTGPLPTSSSAPSHSPTSKTALRRLSSRVSHLESAFTDAGLILVREQELRRQNALLRESMERMEERRKTEEVYAEHLKQFPPGGKATNGSNVTSPNRRGADQAHSPQRHSSPPVQAASPSKPHIHTHHCASAGCVINHAVNAQLRQTGREQAGYLSPTASSSHAATIGHANPRSPSRLDTLHYLKANALHAVTKEALQQVSESVMKDYLRKQQTIEGTRNVPTVVKRTEEDFELEMKHAHAALNPTSPNGLQSFFASPFRT